VKVEASSGSAERNVAQFRQREKVFGAPIVRLRQPNRNAVSLCRVDDELNIRKTTARANSAEVTCNYLSKQHTYSAIKFRSNVFTV
jgi:hypothetical protein